MSELVIPPAWIKRGLCGQTDPDAFFVDKGGPVEPAKRICNGHPGDDKTRYRAPCPVRDLCLQWALATDQQHGVWAGTTPRERRALRQEQEAA